MSSSGRSSRAAASRASRLAQGGGRAPRRAGDGRREAAGIVAGGDRPGVARAVEIRHDPDVGGREAERAGHHLRQHGAVALALRDGIGGHGDAAMRVDGDGGRGERAVLEPAGEAVLMLQHRGDVAHIGDRRLHRRGHPDAIEAPPGAGRRAPRPEVFDGRAGEVRDRAEVAGIVEPARSRAVGHRLHQVAPQHLQPVEAEPVGDAVHQPLQREIDLRAAEAAIEAARRLVGDGDAVLDFEVGDVVGPGHRAVHPVERRRLRALI